MARKKQPKIVIIDPVEAYMQAEHFRVADECLRHMMTIAPDVQKRAMLVIPSMTTSALATELYFKSLIASENSGAIPVEHHLFELFDRIKNQQFKAALEQAWDLNMQRPLLQRMRKAFEQSGEGPFETTLIGSLREGGDVFEKTRYSYEPGNTHASQLGDLPHLIAPIILDVKPEWRGVQKPISRIEIDQ